MLGNFFMLFRSRFVACDIRFVHVLLMIVEMTTFSLVFSVLCVLFWVVVCFVVSFVEWWGDSPWESGICLIGVVLWSSLSEWFGFLLFLSAVLFYLGNRVYRYCDEYSERLQHLYSECRLLSHSEFHVPWVDVIYQSIVWYRSCCCCYCRWNFKLM